MPKSSFRVRFVIVGIFAVFTLGFLLPPSQAQPGRPPGFPAPPRPPGGNASNLGIGGMPGPGGIAGRPPGAITGMPGGISGIGGAGISGISGIGGAGISGIHGIHGTGIHGISGISGIGGMGGPGFGGPGRSETVWTCSKCNFELGRGPVDPGQTSCPRCGVRFNGTTVGPGGFGAMPSTPPGMTGNPGMAAPPATAPPLPMNPAAGGSPYSAPGASAPAPSTTPPPTSSPSTSDSSSSSASDDSSSSSGGRSRTFKLIGIVCGGILLLGAIAALGVVVANANASKPVKRPKRRRMLEDD